MNSLQPTLLVWKEEVVGFGGQVTVPTIVHTYDL